MMDKLNFNMVTECGNENRAVLRYGDTCHIGCFKGSKGEAIEAIGNKYGGASRDRYIAKINELYDTDMTSREERNVDVTAGNDCAIGWASENGHLDVVRYLVSQGASVSADNDYAIRWARQNGHLEVVKYLMEHGASITACDNYAIKLASENGHLEVVKWLVERDVDVTASDNCAVRRANRNGHTKVVNYLVKHGASLE